MDLVESLDAWVSRSDRYPITDFSDMPPDRSVATSTFPTSFLPISPLPRDHRQQCFPVLFRNHPEIPDLFLQAFLHHDFPS